MGVAEVTAAGVDTWSPGWYVNPDGRAAAWLSEHAVVSAAAGAMLVPESIGGHRVGWFPTGLVFAEGHPAGPERLCPPGQLVPRMLDLQESIVEAGLPLNLRERPFDHLGATAEGFAGLRRADFTVNLTLPSRGEGLAVLAGIAACARDGVGKSNIRFGRDRGVETVYLHGSAGKKVLGRVYDKGLEAGWGPRGTILRGEDQRRWPKGERRDPAELTAAASRSNFQRRFYPLWKASKGVIVAGHVAIAERLAEAVQSGELPAQRARLLAGDILLEATGHAAEIAGPSTLRRSRAMRRELGLVLADGVLEEVEVDVGAVLEAVLETDAWERCG